MLKEFAEKRQSRSIIGNLIISTIRKEPNYWAFDLWNNLNSISNQNLLVVHTYKGQNIEIKNVLDPTHF